MKTLTRRSALTGGTAAIAALAIVPSLPILAGHPDAELFAGIANWRKVRDIYEAARDRQYAILKLADAEIPQYAVLLRAFRDAGAAAEAVQDDGQSFHKVLICNRTAEPPRSVLFAKKTRQWSYTKLVESKFR